MYTLQLRHRSRSICVFIIASDSCVFFWGESELWRIIRYGFMPFSQGGFVLRLKLYSDLTGTQLITKKQTIPFCSIESNPPKHLSFAISIVEDGEKKCTIELLFRCLFRIRWKLGRVENTIASQRFSIDCRDV